MSRKYSKFFQPLLILFALIGLPALLWSMMRRSQGEPETIIRRVLSRYTIPEQTIRYWIAVSALETSGWTSRVFKDSNNLFCLIVPKSERLPYGEGQTIFLSMEEAADALYRRVIVPFKYPLSFASLDDLVMTQKEKGYFTAPLAGYMAGAKSWFNKLFPTNF